MKYLKTFPLDELKIDRSFVTDLVTNLDDAALASTIITLAHNLNLGVTAEGVETKEQLAFLRLRGCDSIQGYLISRAVPPAEFEATMFGGTASVAA